METNHISHIHLVNLHVNACQDMMIENIDKVKAVMHVTYGHKEDEHFLSYQVSVEEDHHRLYSLKCEYHYECLHVIDEKEMVMSAIKLITPQIEEIISIITMQTNSKTN